MPFSIPCCRIPLPEHSPAAKYLKMAQTTLINYFFADFFMRQQCLHITILQFIMEKSNG